ncbi:MAG: transposase [Thiomicrorhabdus sp.]|nr:transposase [Thiomicrorhabdus sp.]
MPRTARLVVPNVPHHVTQRGNRREQVFFTDADYEFYLDRLSFYCKKHQVELWAYCLMPNHIHLILLPVSEDGLQKVLKPLHMVYRQYINKQKGWTGHLWQGRFFSSAMDVSHAYSAIRYVERNPVRANLTQTAENYKWSSAAYHCGLVADSITDEIDDMYCLVEASNWSNWLLEEDALANQIIAKNTSKGLPTGSAEFLSALKTEK